MNIVILPIPLKNRLAGSKRLKNLFLNYSDNIEIYLHNFFFYTQDALSDYEIQDVDSRGYYLPKRHVISIWNFNYSGIKYLKRIKDQTGHNILYHYGSPDIKTILILLYAKLTGYKIVFDLVEDVFAIEKGKGLKVKVRFFFSRVFIRYIKWYADGIVAISSHLINLAKRLSNNSIPIIKIPISISKEDFNVPANLVKNEKNDTIIFYGGSFGEKDGLGYLLKAFDKLCNNYPNLKLVLTGRGFNHEMLKFQEELDNIKHKDKVKYLGLLHEKEYYDTLKKCDIFCMTRINSPYANAGFPFKLGEYLATGKPVIASNIGEVSSYLNSSNSFLIEPNSSESILHAVSAILKDPVKAKKIGEEGKAVAFNCFDADTHSRELLEFFKRLN